MFVSKYPLVKFEMFAESSDASDSNDSSNHMESDDDVITITKNKDEGVPPVAIVAEENENMINVEVQSDFHEGEKVDDDGDDEGLSDHDSIFGGDMSGPNDTDMYFDFINAYCQTNEDLDSFFTSGHEVAQPEMKSREVEDVQEAMPPASSQMAGVTMDIDATSKLPPLNVDIRIFMPSVSDLLMTLTSQPPLKR